MSASHFQTYADGRYLNCGSVPLRYLLTILATLAFIQTSHAQKAISLDGFLGPIGENCFSGEGFNKFTRSLGKQLNEPNPQPPYTLVLPIELANYFEQPSLEKGADYYKVFFSLKDLTTYAGLSVHGIQLVIGVENGINAYAVRFNAPISAVRKVFGKAQRNLIALKKRDKDNYIIAEIGFNEMHGKGELACDSST